MTRFHNIGGDVFMGRIWLHPVQWNPLLDLWGDCHAAACLAGDKVEALRALQLIEGLESAIDRANAFVAGRAA